MKRDGVNRMLVLGNLTVVPDFETMLAEASTLSGCSHQVRETLDPMLLAELNSSSVSCCVVVDSGDPESALSKVCWAVGNLPLTPVLLLTSNHTVTLEIDSIAAGADDCVSLGGLNAAAFVRIVARTLQRADRRRRLLDAIPIPMLHATLEGNLHWANGALLALFRCDSLDQLRLLGLQPLLAPFAEQLNQAQAPRHFFTPQVVTPRGGGHRDVLMYVSCLNRLAPAEGVQVLFTDITEVENQRRQLDAAERRARELYDNAPVMMYTVSAKSIVLEVNNHWLSVMGYERDEIIAAATRKFHVDQPAPGPDSPFWQTLQVDDLAAAIKLRLRAKNGRVIEGLASATAVRAADGELVAARMSVLDLTDFNRAQAERDQMERELRLAQKLESVGQLAAGIAHEINTPAQFVSDNLTFLRSSHQDIAPLLEHLKRFQDPDSLRLTAAADSDFLLEEIPKALDQAHDGIRRIRKIVLALKEFSHPGTDDKAPVDLNHIVENTATLARGEWKNVAELRLDLAADLPLVPCRGSEIAQVILNMIVNAAHAIADRKPTDHAPMPSDHAPMPSIVIRTAAEPEHAVICISDTGCGMSEEVQRRIFDPFFTTKEVGRGSGQGLSIARLIIVEKHQGAIAVSSEVGVGTTFTLRLPFNDQERGTAAAPTEQRSERQSC